MKMVNVLSNSEINQIICKTFKSVIDQHIVRDRIINCFTFDEIISTHFPNAEFSEKRKKRFIASEIIPLLNKFSQVTHSTY